VFAIRRLIGAARAQGLELDEGPSAADPAFSARVSIAHAQQLRERAVRELGPALPLVVAGSIDEHLCLMQFAALSCRTMGEVLQLTVAHWSYMTDGFAARAVRRDGAVELQLDVPGSAPLGVRIGVEYLLATLARATCQMVGGGWRPSGIVLGHRPPVPLAAWEATCGVPVRVGDASALVLGEDALALPVAARLSPGAGALVREMLAWYTPRPAPTIADRVAAALVRDLASVAPKVEQVAAELGLSPRSLHRQLAAAGTSYQRVLDRVRCNEAIRQASDPRRPFKAIAAAVGFADPRAFRRAFKRWTGTTPQQFRRRHPPRDGGARSPGASPQPEDADQGLAGADAGDLDGAQLIECGVELEQLLQALDRRAVDRGQQVAGAELQGVGDRVGTDAE
jgi:AraC-like DNA-binding protein